MDDQERRSGNFRKSTWDSDFVQQLTTPYAGKEYTERADKLKDDVKIMIDGTTDVLAQLQLIDDLQRLDVSHHFDDSVQKLLDRIYADDNKDMKNDLHFIALKFRLLRQHGYHVDSKEVFSSFMEEMEKNFKTSLGDDVKGLLSLYEASFLSVEGEPILDLAKDFSTRHLEKKLKQFSSVESLGKQIRHALEFPLHWRVPKLQAKWFMHIYESRPHPNLILLEFAKLYFNMAQACYQDDMKRILRSHTRSGLAEKLSFCRDRPAESFLFALGFSPEAPLGYTREILAIIIQLITVMDDVYDIYGSLEEIELFTKFVERWDINELESLPLYLQILFLDLDNFVNGLAFHVLTDQGFNCIPSLRRAWVKQCRSYLTEARWYHSGYLPSTKEYLNNAWISIAIPICLLHSYLCFTNPISNKDVQMLEQYPDIIRLPAITFRLADDLGTSSDEIERGDVPKIIQCYMHETGCCEEEARVYVKCMISEWWKKMNKEISMVEKPFRKFGVAAMNAVRMAHYFYLNNGDGFGNDPNSETKEDLISLIVHPIPMPSP